MQFQTLGHFSALKQLPRPLRVTQTVRPLPLGRKNMLRHKMVTIANANPHGVLDAQRLREFEKKIGVALPYDYRDFLSQFNGGEPSPEGFWIVQEEDGSNVHEFLGLHNGPKWLSLDGTKNSELGIPESLLPIANDGLGNMVCLKITGNDFGAVFFVDHDQHPFENRESFEGITKLKGSFSEFLSSLQVLDEDKAA
jgi:hypothetical protein